MIDHLIKLRHYLHQHPELSGEEFNTADHIVRELKHCKPEVIKTGIGGTGVLAGFKARNGSPRHRILFRAELDAVAVEEETGLAYASQNAGKMHACGHDGHMAILAGLAHRLKEERPVNVEVYLLFQPAEETGKGAGQVIRDPVFSDLEVDHAYALHNLPGYPAKRVFIKSGPFACASTGIDITIKGHYSHAAYPEKGLNPAPVVADLIRKINRELEEFLTESELNKMAFTYIRMGEPAFGISPGQARVGCTLRAATDEALKAGTGIVKKVVEQIDRDFAGSITAEAVEPFAATINSRQGTEIVTTVSRRQGIGVEPLKTPFPWSEDFGEFRKRFPVTIFGLGAGTDLSPLHAEGYDFNDQLISTGLEIFRGVVDYYSSL